MNNSGMWENLDTSCFSAFRIIFAVGLFSDFAHAFAPWLRNTFRQTIHFPAGKEWGNQGNGFAGRGKRIPTGRSWLRKICLVRGSNFAVGRYASASRKTSLTLVVRSWDFSEE